MTALVVACIVFAVSVYSLWYARHSYYRITDRPLWFAPCEGMEHALACAPRDGQCGKCGGTK